MPRRERTDCCIDRAIDEHSAFTDKTYERVLSYEFAGRFLGDFERRRATTVRKTDEWKLFYRGRRHSITPLFQVTVSDVCTDSLTQTLCGFHSRERFMNALRK